MDAFALARHLRNMEITGLPVSPATAMLLQSRDKTLIRTLFDEMGIIDQIFEIDPAAPPAGYDGREYAKVYFRWAISSDQLNPPDLALAGKYREELEHIHIGHRMRGREGANEAFQTLFELSREFAVLAEEAKPLLIPISALENLPVPRYAIDRYPIYQYLRQNRV